ncbi:uncharacterized protein LOC111716104 [Eurytemora carolleeae]|uniref:uncharacterized protein LOC111716104 n=1 Tax=Eurytemora carolleeae TaxID=1294199 RepID=UPI000C75A189|nr:uncharacterized protein LOC111716104 [Eurytemora carolleeae]|eukprot:XP_023347289.1 uncharacterized protein LOC111716104 [Eurytemora affinis]
MAVEKDFNWEDDLMTKSFQRQSSHLSKLADQYGPDYGKPVPGSDSERRSLEYQQNVVDEVSSLCYQIAQFGFKSKDGSECIKFGDLFKVENVNKRDCLQKIQKVQGKR